MRAHLFGGEKVFQMPDVLLDGRQIFQGLVVVECRRADAEGVEPGLVRGKSW